jgi:hypothetical protein
MDLNFVQHPGLKCPLRRAGIVYQQIPVPRPPPEPSRLRSRRSCRYIPDAQHAGSGISWKVAAPAPSTRPSGSCSWSLAGGAALLSAYGRAAATVGTW